MNKLSSNKTALLLAFATFVLGGITGGFLTATFMGRNMMKMLRHGPPHMNEFMLRRMTSDLTLDDAQEKEVKRIVDEISKEMLELHRQFRPQFHAILDRHVPEIEKILRPDQLQKFRKMEELRRSDKHDPSSGPMPFPPENR
jgi:uncharacterized protein YneF (UPF0154 family)